jgi:hypothetical protein
VGAGPELCGGSKLAAARDPGALQLLWGLSLAHGVKEELVKNRSTLGDSS